jgi:hypothetical protein
VRNDTFVHSQATIYVTVCGGGAHTGIFKHWRLVAPQLDEFKNEADDATSCTM